MSAIIQEIPPRGELYQAARRVRGKVLREPLGMGPVVEVFPFELEAWHLVARVPDRVVGCVLFHPRGKSGRLFQMAVLEEHRGCGIGQALVNHLEALAVTRGIHSIFLHARDYAIPFYARCGYVGRGPFFEEIGIPHQRMEKTLLGVC
jgi:GNAT superfamily N-acetyltransferase